MADSNLGTATIVYDHPEEGTVEKTVKNEHVAYFQDHWILKRDEDEAGNDVVRRIPVERVHYVDRSVETFEDEIGSVRKQVENVANDIRSKLLGTGSERDQRTGEPVEITVEDDSEPGDDSTER
ncbi:hypothetical protein [Salinibaculum rarum]|uniref:hypothetical protein n=1 Tax=Salinibaculum rarum TaxID=3058903 RepID=UPI00266036CA|nr:hypothetical protein [Salinibaculum sp. KK48]